MTQKMMLLAAQVGVLGAISPASFAPGPTSSGWMSAAQFQNFMAVVNTGVLGAAATVDAKIEQATSAAGAGIKDLTGSNITQIVKASGDNVQSIITFGTDSLDIANNFSWFRVTVTVGTAASFLGVLVLGADQRIGPIANIDAATVKEIITVV